MAEMDDEARYEASVRSFELEQAKKQVTTKLDLNGSRLCQKLTVKLSTEIQKQLAAFASMEACAGIQGNSSAAYKARANHYGGVSSWGGFLPIRRWVDQAFADIKVRQSSLTVTKSFKAREGKGKWGRANSPAIIKRYLEYYLRPGKEKRVFEPTGAQIDAAVTKTPEMRKLRREYSSAAKRGDISAMAGLSSQMRTVREDLEKDYRQHGIPSGGDLFLRSGTEIINGLAQQMRRNQIHAINTMYPPNAESTRALKEADPSAIAPDKVLVWTGEMINSVSSWVNVSTSAKGRHGQYRQI